MSWTPPIQRCHATAPAGAILEVLLGSRQGAGPNQSAANRLLRSLSSQRTSGDGLYYDDHNEPILVDPWGEPFYFIADLKGAGKIPNPDPRDNKTHPFIEKPIIMFSAGPDGNPNTWDDNVLSWK